MDDRYSPEGTVPEALSYVALGEMMVRYSRDMDVAAVQEAMEKRAVWMLEEIRRVLEDKSLDDPECCQKVDEIVRIFFQGAGVRSERHIEYD